MKAKFILSCESTVDLPYAYVSGRCGPETAAVFFFGEERGPYCKHE